MKKRILSILLAAVMMMTLIPAIALVSYAADEELVKDYSYYENLWYNDGHLVSFVDVYGTQDSMTANNAAGANADALLLMGTLGSQNVQGANTGTRTYIKIIGGTNVGKYYLFNTPTNNFISNGAFASAANGATNIYEYVDKVNKPEYHVHLGETFTYDQATTVGVGASNTADSLDALYRTAGNSFTVENTLIIDDDAFQANLSGETGNFNRFMYTTKFGTANTTTSQDSWFVYRPLFEANTGTTKAGQTQVMTGHNGTNTVAQKTLPESLGKNSTIHAAVTYTIETKNETTLTYSVKNNIYYKGTSNVAESKDNISLTTNCANLTSQNANTMIMASAKEYSNMVYLRVYDCALTDAQLAQNHFADLCYFYKVDLTDYNTLNAKGLINDDFYAQFASLEVNKTDAGTVQGKITALKEQAAAAEAAAAEALTFVGYQASLHTNVGIRGVFKVDTTKLEGYKVVAYGALVGMAQTGADFDDYTIAYDGEAITSSRAAVISSLNVGFKTIQNAEKAYLNGSSENLDDYNMFAYTLNYINGSIDRDGVVEGTDLVDENKDKEMFFRAFIILEINGCQYISYVDGASSNYENTSVSLAEVYGYYKTYNDGEYADNVCITKVVG